MIRVSADAGPLVALFNVRDHAHTRAWKELESSRFRTVVCLPVLTEVLHLTASPKARARLTRTLTDGVLSLDGPVDPRRTTNRALSWLERYAEHSPDFADAFLTCWFEEDPSLRVWTFDGEFRDVWRTLGGRRVRLVE